MDETEEEGVTLSDKSRFLNESNYVLKFPLLYTEVGECSSLLERHNFTLIVYCKRLG